MENAYVTLVLENSVEVAYKRAPGMADVQLRTFVWVLCFVVAGPSIHSLPTVHVCVA